MSRSHSPLSIMAPRPGLLVRVPVLLKLIILSLIGIFIYQLHEIWQLLLLIAPAAFTLRLARAAFSWRALRGLLMFISFFFLANLVSSGWQYAVVHALKVIILYLFAYAVTASTHFSAFLDFFTKLAAPLKFFGIGPRRVGLAFAMTVRFIPEIFAIKAEVREVQIARGTHRRPLALLLPITFRSLEIAHTTSMAIVARGFEDVEDKGDEPPARPGADTPSRRD